MIAEGGKSPSSTQSDKTKSVYFTSCSPNRRNNTTSLETVKSLYSSVCLTPFGLVSTLPALHNCLHRNKSLKNTIMARLYASFSNTLKKIKNWTSFRQTGNLSQGRKSNNRNFFPFIFYICHVIYVHHNNRSQSNFRVTLKNGFGKCSLFVLSANGWKYAWRKLWWTILFPAKENPG